MVLRKNSYVDRLVDKKIEDYLKIFGAVNIEGPKWCGKTWASLNHAKSSVFLDDEEAQIKADFSLDFILNDEKPLLIDEWNIIPKIWDAVRRKCDELENKGNFILTCSTKLTDQMTKNSIKHSGAGRIGTIKMYTMSLYESKESTGKVSLTNLYNGIFTPGINDNIELNDLANIIIRGGWPANINNLSDSNFIIPRTYIDALLNSDICDDKKRDKNRMLMILKSLARNESTIANNSTLLKDIKDDFSIGDETKSRVTLMDYLDVLNRLHIIENQNFYSENYRSPSRVGKSFKRHFTDPSLSCALLNLTKDKLVNDLNTFGFMFEALVERDLRIYIEYLNGNLYHFRDNVTGLEIDAVLEFSDGDYALCEIKLGLNQIEEAKKNLLEFYNNAVKKPKFMCIIVGCTDIIARDPETGIYIFPVTALKP